MDCHHRFSLSLSPSLSLSLSLTLSLSVCFSSSMHPPLLRSALHFCITDKEIHAMHNSNPNSDSLHLARPVRLSLYMGKAKGSGTRLAMHHRITYRLDPGGSSRTWLHGLTDSIATALKINLIPVPLTPQASLLMGDLSPIPSHADRHNSLLAVCLAAFCICLVAPINHPEPSHLNPRCLQTS